MRSPASPAVSLGSSSTNQPSVAGLRLVGSVQSDRQSVVRQATRTSSGPSPLVQVNIPASSSSKGGLRPQEWAYQKTHVVYQSLQIPKLLMGGELELSRFNITVTGILAMIGVMHLNWHLVLMAVLFGGPVQWAIRMLSDEDPDYVKTYIEGLSCPHLRSPTE